METTSVNLFSINGPNNLFSIANDELNTCAMNQYLSDWNKSIESHLCSITNLLSSDEIIQIVKDYNALKADRTDIGFNLFTLISDLYYRENFHRDVIYEFLNQNGSHKKGNKYLMLFLDMLNIDYNLFNNAIVEKEYPIDNRRRIDTLIKDEDSKKAIIIENKMNNAGDIHRQLPDYFNYVKRLGYEVKCIVYLPLLHDKVPDKSGWSKDEIEAVHNCLQIIPAFSSKGKINLCDNWLIPCINMTDDLDCLSGLRQYVKLIKYLNINDMDNVILEKFYASLKDGDNLKTASSIRNMLNDLPAFLATSIRNKYLTNFYPFASIWIYKNTCTVFERFTLDGDKHFKLEIDCNDYGYDMLFYPYNVQDNIKSIFPNSVALKDFKQKQGALPHLFFQHIDFKEDDKVFIIIDLLLTELSEMKLKFKE